VGDLRINSSDDNTLIFPETLIIFGAKLGKLDTVLANREPNVGVELVPDPLLNPEYITLTLSLLRLPAPLDLTKGCTVFFKNALTLASGAIFIFSLDDPSQRNIFIPYRPTVDEDLLKVPPCPTLYLLISLVTASMI
jgi:hypothetical protein